jgi:hypothetical protein
MYHLNMDPPTAYRGPAFAAASLTSSDPPRPPNGGKPVKEGGRRKGKKPAFDIAAFRGMSPERKKDLLSQVWGRHVLQAMLLFPSRKWDARMFV